MYRGVGHLVIASIFLGSVAMPSFDMTNPKHSTFWWKRWVFLGLSFKFASLRRVNTSLNQSTCSSKVRLKIIMSSMYIRHISQWRPVSTFSINLSKVAGAFARPKGITLKWKSPYWFQNAVFSLSSGCIGTCQYPLERSSVENHTDPCNASKDSSMRGSGYESLIVKEFTNLKSTHVRRDPSFFVTRTRGDDQLLVEGSITPSSSIQSNAFLKSLRLDNGIRLSGCLTPPVPDIFILCESTWVVDNSSRDFTYISWKSRTKSLATPCWLSVSLWSHPSKTTLKYCETSLDTLSSVSAFSSPVSTSWLSSEQLTGIHHWFTLGYIHILV